MNGSILPVVGRAIATLILLAGCGSATIGDPPEVGGDDASTTAAPDAAAVPDAIACDDGERNARGADGTCYSYFGELRTWSEAIAACAARGGHLAAPTGPDEVAILAALPTDPDTHPDVWLGGTDVDDEMSWTWFSGEAWGYENWRAGEPNDGNDDLVAEDCLVLESDDAGLWDDRPCDRDYPYLCER